jgi:hypothetical protein
METKPFLRACLGSCLLAAALAGAEPDEGIAFPAIGKIKPRHARDIAASNWSVGAETMDRDYTVYDHWKSWLGPLGVKKARIQGGWAKTEKQKGVFDYAWLDHVILDMTAQGVEPWMCLCYGNPIYEGGGDPQIRGRVPSSPEGLAAWAAWVKKTVERYQKQIDEWEVWNEPNYSIAAADYARFLVLTADAVKAVQPNATVIGFGLGSGVDYKYARSVLEILRPMGRLGVIDQISHHRHQLNPDVRDPEIELEKVVAEFSDSIVIRQGEAGCPSERGTKRAASNYPWTELMQAKHVLRRLLTDLAHDKPSSVFAIVDMKYPDEMNRKGLLRARDDRTVEYAKPAYYAVQNLTAIFDNRLMRIADFAAEGEAAGKPLSAFAYRHEPSNHSVVTVWFKGDVPTNDNSKTAIDFTFRNTSFTAPVYVDLRTGRVYAIPRDRWSSAGGKTTFKQIPVYDSPILIAERTTLPLAPLPPP